MKGFLWLIFLINILILPDLAQAQSLNGIALVRVASRHIKIEMHFAVKLEKTGVSFVAIDDFGGTPFAIQLGAKSMTIAGAWGTSTSKSSSKVKSLLSMPITQEQLVSLMWGNETTVRKILEVSFTDLVASEWTNPYPQHLLIKNGRNEFEFTWVSAKYEN